MEESTQTETKVEPVEPVVEVEDKKKNPLTGYVIGFVVAALLGGALFWGIQAKDGSLTKNVSDSARDTGPVASVNGKEVPRVSFERSVAQVTAIAQQQGANVSDKAVQEQIEERALETVINTALLIQSAEEAGVAIEAEKIDEQIAVLEEQFGSAQALEAQAEQLGMSMEDLRVDVEEQLEVDVFVRQSAEFTAIAVTEEAVSAFYDSLIAQGQELPSFEEVAPQIEQQLQAQAQEAALNELITRLRAEAEIEVLI